MNQNEPLKVKTETEITNAQPLKHKMEPDGHHHRCSVCGLDEDEIRDDECKGKSAQPPSPDVEQRIRECILELISKPSKSMDEDYEYAVRFP